MTKSRIAGGTARLAALVVVFFVASCADTPHSLLSGSSSAPPEIEQACAFAAMKCSHCHPIDRVVAARGIGDRRWQMYVEEMRLKPSSGISPSDAGVVFRCLQFLEQACLGCKQGRS